MRKSRKVIADVAASPLPLPPKPSKIKDSKRLCFGCMSKPAGLILMPGKVEIMTNGFCSLHCAAAYGVRIFHNARMCWDEVAKLWVAQDGSKAEPPVATLHAPHLTANLPTDEEVRKAVDNDA